MVLTCQKDTFWLEHLGSLFCSYELIPVASMNFVEQMNALTRLVILVSIVLFLIGFKQSVLFLLLSLLFIIILYYIQMKTVSENYRSPCIQQTNVNVLRCADLSNSKRFCNDTRQLDGTPDNPGAFNNKTWTSVNQKLAGPPNPKTLIAPVVTVPSHDLSYWKANNMITHSAINDETQNDVYQSGYQVSTCCAPTYDCRETCGLLIPGKQPQYQPEYQPRYQQQYYQQAVSQQAMSQQGANQQGMTHQGGNQQGFVENFGNVPFLRTTPVDKLINNYSDYGMINTECGYNPQQLFTAGLPTNLPAGACDQDPALKEYNRNLFTQTIQPGVYTTSQVNQPINSNMGISFTQQFLPTTRQIDMVTGEVNYVEHDPNIIEPLPKPLEQPTINEANVYDPRFSGYGTSYRSYNDPVVGQTRFYYDDINAIRMPNYITRSNIDFAKFADSYGPIQAGNEFGNKYNSDIRALANDAFLNANIAQRDSLQSSLLRKRNDEMWQLRKAPQGPRQRMVGGMGSW